MQFEILEHSEENIRIKINGFFVDFYDYINEETDQVIEDTIAFTVSKTLDNAGCLVSPLVDGCITEDEVNEPLVITFCG